MQDIASILKQFRLEKDWSFQRLSQWTSVQVGVLHRIESRRGNPNARTLYKLQKAIPQIDLLVKQQEEEKRKQQEEEGKKKLVKESASLEVSVSS